jgi:3',5'-cyclic AMP phosphodiesterase CpdA
MTRIAHLTDLHLLEPVYSKRAGVDRYRLLYLSFGRPLNAEARRHRFEMGLSRALSEGVDHILLTGDMTEDGEPEQYEVLAEVLENYRVDPWRITMIPGNHDIYYHRDAWNWALKGPLARYAENCREGALTVLRDAVIKPVYTLTNQHFTRSAGVIRPEDVLAIDRIAHDPLTKNRALIVAQHHPPTAYWAQLHNWIDGLLDDRFMRTLLESDPDLNVVHGHTHRSATRRFFGRPHPQVFSAEAATDGDNLVRFYRTRGSRLEVEEPSGVFDHRIRLEVNGDRRLHYQLYPAQLPGMTS